MTDEPPPVERERPSGLRETRFGVSYFEPSVRAVFDVVELRRKSGELWGELTVRCRLDGIKVQLDGDRVRQGNFNFSSIDARTKWANALKSMSPPDLVFDWANLVERVCQAVLDYDREGSVKGGVITGKRLAAGRPWAAWPLVPHREIASMFARGGAGKTSLVATLALSMALGRSLIPGVRVDRPYRVLILDWETNQETADDLWGLIADTHHVAIPDGAWYEPMETSLERCLPRIAALTDRHRADLVVVDSAQMAMLSSGDWSDPAESVTRMYQALRRLGLWGIVIDHIASDDLKSRRVPVKAYGCYSADTEVLTRRGWLTHDQLTDQDVVLAFDPAGDAYRWETPTARWAYDYAGPMVHLATKATDALVTPNHRMLVKPAVAQTGWRFVLADALPRSDWVSAVGATPPDGPEQTTFEEAGERFPMDTWLRFLGWYVAEGSTQNGRLRIGQTLGPIETAITATLTELGLPYWRRVYQRAPTHRPIAAIATPKSRTARLAAWLDANVGRGSTRKRLPKFVWGLPARQQAILLDALIDGDGHRRANGGRTYTTASRELADDVQRLALLCGQTAAIGAYPSGKAWYVGITARRTTEFRTSRAVSVEPYDGKVYCLTVPSGAYVTRRRGRVAIQGNSVFKANFARHNVALHVSETNGDTSQVYLLCPKSNLTRDRFALAGTYERSDDVLRWEFGNQDFTLYERLVAGDVVARADEPDPSALTPAELRLLDALGRWEPDGTTTVNLAAELAVSPVAARSTLNRLADRGLAEGTDGRGGRGNAKAWRLTGAGRRVAEPSEPPDNISPLFPDD